MPLLEHSTTAKRVGKARTHKVRSHRHDASVNPAFFNATRQRHVVLTSMPRNAFGPIPAEGRRRFTILRTANERSLKGLDGYGNSFGRRQDVGRQCRSCRVFVFEQERTSAEVSSVALTPDACFCLTTSRRCACLHTNVRPLPPRKLLPACASTRSS